MNKLYRCWYKENDYVKSKSERHYKAKLEWLTQKNKKAHEKEPPNKIDNTTMGDCVLPESFESNPRIYGGVDLTIDEVELLKLPPKFAIYKKLDELLLESQFEKAVTCLWWNSQPPRTNENEQKYPREEIFDHEENNFDFSFMNASRLPFNKRVYMPPYADETTEARITHTRKLKHL